MFLQRVWSKKTVSNWQSFTLQVQESDGQSNSKHFDEESRETTDDGLDLFTDHQVHLSTSRQWLCLSCMTSAVFFLSLIDWNNFYCITFDHCTLFLSENMRNKHIATFTRNLKAIETLVVFSLIYFVGASIFLPQHWKLLGPERLNPLKLLGMNRVKEISKNGNRCGHIQEDRMWLPQWLV